MLFGSLFGLAAVKGGCDTDLRGGISMCERKRRRIFAVMVAQGYARRLVNIRFFSSETVCLELAEER